MKFGLARSGGDVSDAAHFIHRHAAPAIGAVSFGAVPGVVAKFARVRHGVKCPELFAGDDIKSPDILLKTRHHDDVVKDGRTGGSGTKFILRPARQKRPAINTKIG